MKSRSASRSWRALPVVVAVAFVTLPAWDAPAEPASPRTVLMVWSAPGVPESTVERFHAAFGQQLEASGVLVPREEVAHVLAVRHKQASLCAFSEGCLISVAREVKAQVAVKAELRFQGVGLALRVTRYDTGTGAQVDSVAAAALPGTEELRKAIGTCARRLFGPASKTAADVRQEETEGDEEDEEAPAPVIIVNPQRAPAAVPVVVIPRRQPAPAPAAAPPAPVRSESAVSEPAAQEVPRPPADAPPAQAEREPAPAESLPHPERSGRHGVMVLNLQAIGVDAESVAPFASLIAAQIATHPGYDVTSTDDVQKLMEHQSLTQAAGCSGDDNCLVQVSKKLNADLVVNGTVGRVGESYLLTLVLVQADDVRASHRATATGSRTQDLVKALPECLEKLFGWGKTSVAAFHLPKAKHQSFAVFALKPTGLTPETAANLTHVLSTEVKGIDGATVVSRDDIAAMLQLQAARQKTGCDDPSCMSEIGNALGVDRLITGDAGKVGSLYLVNLRLIDVRQGVVENRVTESFEGNEEQLLRSVRFATRNLLGISEPAKGDMAITSSQNAADIFVDEGKPVRTPAHVVDLGVGKHAVRVAAGGYFDWHGDVYVDPHETTSIWAQMSARPQAWYQKWWVWTIAGTFLAGGAATAVVVTRMKPQAGVVGVTFQ
jgi:TolB-like protein